MDVTNFMSSSNDKYFIETHSDDYIETTHFETKSGGQFIVEGHFYIGDWVEVFVVSGPDYEDTMTDVQVSKVIEYSGYEPYL